MLLPAAPDDVELAVDPDRLLHQPRQSRALERGQVLAREVADEVGCREDGLTVDELQWGSLLTIR